MRVGTVLFARLQFSVQVLHQIRPLAFLAFGAGFAFLPAGRHAGCVDYPPPLSKFGDPEPPTVPVWDSRHLALLAWNQVPLWE